MSEHYQGPEFRTVAEIRGADDGSTATTITFARFGVWNEIWTPYEGRFLEMLEPGAFAATFAERGDQIKVLFNHGHDPSIGNKALGVARNLRETDRGPAGDVEWFDRPYVDDVRAGLPPAVAQSVYGASYRFGVVAESWNDKPERSKWNPDGLPERTISRVNVAEFGPVTFPADEGTTALMGVRSLNDKFAPAPQTDREETSVENPLAGVPGSTVDTDRAAIVTAFAIARRHAAYPYGYAGNPTISKGKLK